jgi:two-component system nitrate/nitrite response regulator NarL
MCGVAHVVSVVCVVVHGSRIVREGLRTILAKSQFDPVCTASTAEELPSGIAGAGQQVLVLIGVREGENLGEVLSAAKARFPGGQLVVVGDARKRELVATAVASEGTSFVDENVATATLIKQLELVVQGEAVISVSLLKRLLGVGSAQPAAPTTVDQVQLPDADEQPPLPQAEDDVAANTQLSRREAAILHALVEGIPNKVIAYRLCITEATVKVHVKAILRKIRAKNRTQAAIWALRHQAPPKLVHAEAATQPQVSNGPLAIDLETESRSRPLQGRRTSSLAPTG